MSDRQEDGGGKSFMGCIVCIEQHRIYKTPLKTDFALTFFLNIKTVQNDFYLLKAFNKIYF